MDPTAEVIVQTTKGEIQIELFAKELPEFARPFLQNCLDNKYKDISFDKVLPNLVQTGATGSGTAYKKKFHSRLKFSIKGCVGLVNSADDKYASVDGFFITTKEAPELNNHYVMIGRVVGDSIYNVIKMSQNDLKEDGETPVHPVFIKETRVTKKFFTDLEASGEEIKAEEPKKKKRKAIKLAYDEEEGADGESEFRMRSAHEMLGDKKLAKADSDHAEKNTAHKADKKIDENKAELHKDLHVVNQKGKIKDLAASSLEIQQLGTTRLEIMSADVITKRKESEKLPQNLERDPTIDPPYDSDLDLPEDTVEYEQLCKHQYVCS
uniref:PPIase cyclophilin-type domain-containing protein n=1 Tax=Candidozyma auris TaxID=498019 RepID=A0A0L0NZU6_CANAR